MVAGDHNELIRVANDLKNETETLIDLYVEASGKSKNEIVDIMEREELFNAKKALSLNFISKIENNEGESSPINTNQKDDNMNDEQEKAVSEMEKGLNFFRNLFKPNESPKNIVLSDTNGAILEFDSETENGIVEGTAVTLDGAPAS